MIKCKYCGGDNPDDNKFCMHCGAPLDHDAQDAAEQQGFTEEHLPAQTDVPEPEQPYEDVPPSYEPTYSASNQYVEPVPIAGLVAWAIFVILGCWIPGVVALYYIFKINKAATFEEQQQLLGNARKVLIVGTVLSALNLFRMIAGNAS